MTIRAQALKQAHRAGLMLKKPGRYWLSGALLLAALYF
jgi:hypothetical protein